MKLITALILFTALAHSAVAPGSIVSIYGSNFAPATQMASILPLPTEMQLTSVTIDGVLCPLFYVSPTQINIQVPFETAIGARSLRVFVGGSGSNAVLFSVAPNAPDIFKYGANSAIAFTEDGLNGPEHPANPGSVIVVYMTGQGAVTNAPKTGVAAAAMSLTIAPTMVAISNIASEVIFSGLVPGYVGLLQVNVRVPASVQSGDQVLIIRIGDAISFPATIRVGSGLKLN